jgi:hypothetical protein
MLSQVQLRRLMCALMPQTLKAGQSAPADGLYRVTHYQHRLPHLVSVIRGTTLPSCNKCGTHVRFELLGPVSEIEGLYSDYDFKNGTSE